VVLFLFGAKMLKYYCGELMRRPNHRERKKGHKDKKWQRLEREVRCIR
jgi:hypothetical protein